MPSCVYCDKQFPEGISLAKHQHLISEHWETVYSVQGGGRVDRSARYSLIEDSRIIKPRPQSKSSRTKQVDEAAMTKQEEAARTAKTDQKPASSTYNNSSALKRHITSTYATPVVPTKAKRTRKFGSVIQLSSLEDITSSVATTTKNGEDASAKSEMAKGGLVKQVDKAARTKQVETARPAKTGQKPGSKTYAGWSSSSGNSKNKTVFIGGNPNNNSSVFKRHSITTPAAVPTKAKRPFKFGSLIQPSSLDDIASSVATTTKNATSGGDYVSAMSRMATGDLDFE